MDDARARSFGAAAEDYERWRPTYPIEALSWLLPANARDVADVGAGTGKLTRSLLDHGLRVSAVEPDPAMLAVLRRTCPQADVWQADAGALPWADASLDAVVVAQAWHWFPHAAAVREVRRVLRPAGRLGLVWNGVAAGPGWWDEVQRLDPTHQPLEPLEPFDLERSAPGLPVDELEVTTVTWNRHVTPDEVRGCLSTHSIFAVMEPTRREHLLDKARSIVTSACREADTATVAWPHLSLCIRWTPRDLPSGP